MKTKEEMIKELKEGICRVVFTKKNGEERDMTCTLSSIYLPAAKVGARKKSEVTTDAIAVYDINAEGWRSFNISNVKIFEWVSA